MCPTSGTDGEMISGLLANQADFAVLGAPELIDLWDRSFDSPGAIHALSNVALQPFMLVTRSPAVNTLADLGPADAIAVQYFHAGNPGITQAVLAAQQEANAFIKHYPKDAAAIYLSLTGGRRQQNDLAGMIADPDIAWTTLPQRLIEFVAFRHKVGWLPHMHLSWKDLVLPEAQAGAGS